MATWNATFDATPSDGDSPTLGDDVIRATRAAIEERAKNEHTTYTGDLTGGVAASDWLHKAGSAVVFFAATASAPTTRVNGASLIDGVLWYDTTLGILKVRSGGAWVGVVATSATTTEYVNDQGGGADLLVKIINIGDWNMDTTAFVNINHGLTMSKIRGCEAIVINDVGTTGYTIHYENGGYAISATYVQVFRANGGLFDSVNFDSTGYNRGWITIWYTA